MSLIESNATHSILVFGWYNFKIYQQACARALEQIGTTVIKLSCKSCFKDNFSSRLQRYIGVGPAIQMLNDQLIETVEQQKPDITFIYNNHFVRPKTLEHLQGKTWLAGCTNDNPFGKTFGKLHWRNFRNTIRYYDSWHVGRESNLDEFKAAGAKNVRLLMSYYLPWEIDSCCKKPIEEFEYDVVFVGHGEGDNRREYIEALIESGINVRIFGPPKSWKSCLGKKLLKRLPQIYPVYGLEYREIIRKSKICLVFLSEINKDTYTRRCFEIPSWGGFMMAPRTNMLSRLYVEGEEAEYFTTPDELVEKCRKYINNDAERGWIAQNGQRRCFRDSHDVIARMQQWLNDIIEFQSKDMK